MPHRFYGPKRLRSWASPVLLLSLLVLLQPSAARAQNEEIRSNQSETDTDLGVIPVRVVNGHLVVLVDLVGLQFQNAISLEISFEYPDTLTLHPDVFPWLGMDPEALERGDDVFIDILIEPGIRWSIPGSEIVRELSDERGKAQIRTTTLYSSGLDERKLKGTIGMGFLKNYSVTLDLSQGQMILARPRAQGDASSVMGQADVVIRRFEYQDGKLQVPLRYANNRSGRMVIGGSYYDTFVDADLARSLDVPAGNISPAWLVDSANGEKRFDLSRYVAFRPKGFPEASSAQVEDPDHPVLVTGVNLLEHFRVELDWSNRAIGFTQTQPPDYPEQDLEFFQAEIAGTSDAMLAYLTRYPEERLSHEAANLLATWRVEKDNASDDEVLEALQWAMDTSLPGREIETCFTYMGRFRKLPGRSDLAIATGKECLQYSREAFDPRVVYDTHNALGEEYLKQEELDLAWRHFLSAAFITPEDPLINLNLARVYDRQGRVRRAFSRYRRVAAAIEADRLKDTPEVEAEVRAAMVRLREQLPANDTLLEGFDVRDR